MSLMNNRTSLRLWLSLLLLGIAASAQESTKVPAGSAQNGVPMQRTIRPTPLRTSPQAASAPEVKQLAVGAMAPDFASNDLTGKTVRFSDFKDKVLVLDFWATWCGPCLASLPHTEEVAKRYKDQGVVILASCTSDTRAKFEEWVRANQAKYPDIAFTCDPNERGSATFDERASRKLYGVSGIPTQFVIGRDGKVVSVLSGYSKGDVRLEAGLARAGIKVDPAVAAEGEAQSKKGGS